MSKLSKEVYTKEEMVGYLKKYTLKYGVPFGLFGAYAKGTAKWSSDIDVVAKEDILSADDIENIRDNIRKDLGKNSDICSYVGMREEKERLEKLSIELGLGEALL